MEVSAARQSFPGEPLIAAMWISKFLIVIIGLFLGEITLVALFLILNLTIAIGMLNGLIIFCANLISVINSEVRINNSNVLFDVI